MSAYQYLEVEKTDHIACVTMSNPPTHTLVAAGVEELHQAVDALQDDDVRVVVFRGGGEGIFIAHYEVGELAATSGARQKERAGAEAGTGRTETLHAFHRLCLKLEASPFLTIAALNGRAAGGGLEFALACDFRLTSDGPWKFGLPETSVGIIPGAGGTQRMARLLGTARALDLVLHARLMNPAEALQLGLVHRVFPAAEFDEKTDAFAKDLAGRAPIAMAAAKAAIHQGAGLPLSEALAFEQQQFDKTIRSEDAAGALTSVLKGKRWQWTGR